MVAYRANGATAHLPDRFESIGYFELVRQPPRIHLGKGHVVFDIVQVGDVETYESKLAVFVHKLVAVAMNKQGYKKPLHLSTPFDNYVITNLLLSIRNNRLISSRSASEIQCLLTNHQ